MKIRILKTVAGLLFILLLSVQLNAQDPTEPPPPPTNFGGGGNGPVGGGGAPIGEGLFFLTILGASYGAKKFYQIKKNNLPE